MMFSALKRVFRHPAYGVFAIGISLVVFAFATWLPNISLIIEIMGHAEATFSQKIELPIALLGSIATNFSVLSATYTVLIALLFGINLSLIVYLIRNRVNVIQQSGATSGVLGIISGLLGVGCAACGSLILTSVLSLVGAAGALSILPLGGGEFGILGVLLLLWSLYSITKQIEAPLVCLS